MIKTIVVALTICLIEILVIVIASPMAKPSLVLRFLPEDVRLAGDRTILNHRRKSRLRRTFYLGYFSYLCWQE